MNYKKYTAKEIKKEHENYGIAEGEETYHCDNCEECMALRFCDYYNDAPYSGDECIIEIFKTLRIEEMFKYNKVTPEVINSLVDDIGTLKEDFLTREILPKTVELLKSLGATHDILSLFSSYGDTLNKTTFLQMLDSLVKE